MHLVGYDKIIASRGYKICPYRNSYYFASIAGISITCTCRSKSVEAQKKKTNKKQFLHIRRDV